VKLNDALIHIITSIVGQSVFTICVAYDTSIFAMNAVACTECWAVSQPGLGTITVHIIQNNWTFSTTKQGYSSCNCNCNKARVTLAHLESVHGVTHSLYSHAAFVPAFYIVFNKSWGGILHGARLWQPILAENNYM